MQSDSEAVDDDIISSTPVEILPETSSKVNRPKTVYNKNNIKNLAYYPGELTRPKHPSALKPRNYDSTQAEVHFLRMICEIVELKNEKFRFPNIRTVGTYTTFKNLDHLKDSVTGHRIELDFSSQFYNEMPQMFASIMIMGTVKHKPLVKENEQIFVPYIVVKHWEGWSGKVNFQEFYYNSRRYRSPQVDELIPVIKEHESSSDDLSDDEDFEKTDFFVKLKEDGLLSESTFVVDEKTNNCSMSSTQDFEKTEFLNDLESANIKTEPVNECVNTSDEALFDDSVIL